MVEYSSWKRHSKKIGPKDVETSTVCYEYTTKEALELNVEKDLCCLPTSLGYILMAGLNLLIAVKPNVSQQQVEHITVLLYDKMLFGQVVS